MKDLSEDVGLVFVSQQLLITALFLTNQQTLFKHIPLNTVHSALSNNDTRHFYNIIMTN